MKLLRARYLTIGIIAGLLVSGGWLAWAAIQSQVGTNVLNLTPGSTNQNSWIPLNQILTNSDANDLGAAATGSLSSATLDTQTIPYGFNGTTYDRLRTAGIGDASPSTGILGTQPFVFNGATYDRLRSFAGSGDAQSIPTGSLATSNFNFLFNNATWDRQRTNEAADNTTGTGVPGTGILLRNATGPNYRSLTNAAGLADASAGNAFPGSLPMIFNGSTFDRAKSASGTNLTATTSTGIGLTASYSTWAVTSGPAAGAQASASKAAGGGTVRHVATTISACYSDTAVAVARHVNLRDGASGAGTILARWMLGIPAANDSHCVTLNGFSIIGTANTAMTLEFDAAGAGTSEQTVNLTGYSVP